jgi:glutamate N-acetyltransferase/amino-acid N-acetyltransferase
MTGAVSHADAPSPDRDGGWKPKSTTGVSPLAVALPELPPLAGVRLNATAAGIRYQGRTDLVMMEVPPGSTVAGVFTSNKCPGAPVDWCREALKGGKARLVVVNAGNANVFTGRAGRDACAATASAAASLVGCAPHEVFVASTGVIGEVLPHEKLIAALPGLHGGLKPDAWEAAARGIMTTDTFPKASTRVAKIGGAPVRITGFAKGSGMIAPDMATMLCFVFTDAAIPGAALQSMLKKGVDRSFNCTTVDSDTSTSDTVLLIATGQASHGPVSGRELGDFSAKLSDVLMDLALQVIRDGEGAQKLVKIDVTGAVSARSAKRIAMTVANSPLVKTAIAGEDANWGRIVMAVGKAGEPADRDRLSVGVGGVWMAREGGVVLGYDETPVVAHMKGHEIEMAIDIGLGSGKATVWTCDLTHGYIDINGSYRS